MNASSLYVTVLRLVFQNDATNVYRLIPYLRQSLSCSVCGNLLQEPFSPLNSPCQHHECKACIGGRKILKPSCSWCRDRQDTVQNVQLRLLLQCYKSLCEYIKLTPIYDGMQNQVQINTSNSQASSSAQGQSSASGTGGAGGGADSGGSNRLADIIDEGIRFKDEFKSTGGLSKATYSMLPCLYQPAVVPPTAPQTPPPSTNAQVVVQQQQQHLSVPICLPSTTINNLQQQQKSNLLSQASHVLLAKGAAHHQQQRTLIHASQLHSNSSNNNGSSLKQIHIPSSIATVTSIGGGTQTHTNGGTAIYVTKSHAVPPMPIIKTVSNGSALYSVMYAGSGNKITIKRKTDSMSAGNSGAVASSSSSSSASSASTSLSSALGASQQQQSKFNHSGPNQSDQSDPEMKTNANLYTNATTIQANNNYSGQDAALGFKKPPVVVRSKTLAKRKGCRCGNATLTPGKLTCCGQRCPCYVESKACIDCKCRGCRNPHRPDGFKVRPHIPELENLDFHLNAAEQQHQPLMKVVLNGVEGAVSVAGGSTTIPSSSGSRMEMETDSGFLFSSSSGLSNLEGTTSTTEMVGRRAKIIGQGGGGGATVEKPGDMNLHTFQSTSSAGNGPPGKIQVLYTTPSSISQMGSSGLPTIIMGAGSGNGSKMITSGGGGGGATVSMSQMQQLQQALGSSATTTTINFVNIPSSNTTTTSSGSSSSSSNGTTTTFLANNGGGLMNPSSVANTFSLTSGHNVSFHSLFGDDLLGSSSVVTEAVEGLTEEELEGAGGVLIGAYGTDDDEELHVNGETVDLAAMDSSSEDDGGSGNESEV